MNALKSANLGLAFILELTALGAFIYWGFATGESLMVKIVLGIGSAVIGATIWGIFAAPQSEKRMSGIPLIIFKVAFFALAAFALMIAGSTTLGAFFTVLFVVNIILAYVWDQENAVRAKD